MIWWKPGINFVALAILASLSNSCSVDLEAVGFTDFRVCAMWGEGGIVHTLSPFIQIARLWEPPLINCINVANKLGAKGGGILGFC